MSTTATPATPTPRTASAVLLYWLLVVCGLAGLTVVRFDTPKDLVPLWLGTVVGVALGQLVAWLRVRAWLLAVITMCSLWLAPMFLFFVYQSSGGAETCILAFLPAAICGYLSLSERGALVAFWYPAVLWMLVILDGPVASAFDVRSALPLMIGLAALFVAFLRARETRRVAIWRSHGSVRLAASLPRRVLRTSPLRTASQLAWTGLAGVAALVLAAWIAPHLWQKEQGKRASAAAQQAALSAASAAGDEPPCCPENPPEDDKSLRVREYFPLLRGRDGEHLPTPPAGACAVCRNGKSVTSASDEGWTFGGASGGSADGTASGPSGGHSGETAGGTGSGGSGGTSGGIAVGGDPQATSATGATPAHAASPSAPRPTSTVDVPPPRTKTTPRVASPKRTTVVVLQPSAPPKDAGAPWKSVLALCLGGLALHVAVRALRRQLTLRHLTRPFWAEPLDQRISNHWQRMLIGLGDAGIHPELDEQPHALARRVALEGMETCATILERVRHGVRVDAADLEAMHSAAGAVYRAARQKAGLAGRAAALVRWPLA